MGELLVEFESRKRERNGRRTHFRKLIINLVYFTKKKKINTILYKIKKNK